MQGWGALYLRNEYVSSLLPSLGLKASEQVSREHTNPELEETSLR